MTKAPTNITGNRLRRLDRELDLAYCGLAQAQAQKDHKQVRAAKEEILRLKGTLPDTLSEVAESDLLLSKDPDEFYRAADELLKKHAQPQAEMTSDEAKEVYRNAWMQWCLCQDPTEKEKFEVLMDGAQSSITPRPGSVWDAFKETLPGYNEFWAGLKIESLAKIRATFGDAAVEASLKNCEEKS